MAKMMIKANVGRRPHRDCMNLKSDQITVMTLLNAIPEALGGTAGKLRAEIRQGYCSDELYQAILRFQRMNTNMADGIIEPTGPAMIFLNNLAERHLPLNLVGAGGAAILQNTATDIRIESWKQTPQKYRGPTPDQQQTSKWDALKARLHQDQRKSMFVKWALRFLSEQEQRYGKTTGIGAWARAFGHAFIGVPSRQSWDERFLMDGEPLLFDGDTSTVKVNNYGIKDDPPVLLFGDLTHYVMKKYEIVDVAYEHFSSQAVGGP
jgi:hypothetical protein